MRQFKKIRGDGTLKGQMHSVDGLVNDLYNEMSVIKQRLAKLERSGLAEITRLNEEVQAIKDHFGIAVRKRTGLEVREKARARPTPE